MSTFGARRWWALGALALSVLTVGLDTTIVNVALPTLATELNASTQELQWFIVAYSLAFAAMLLPAGLLGDRFGRKKLLLFGLVLFGAASAGSAFSPSAGVLIAARAVLGLGGAFVLPLSLSVLAALFSEEERPSATAVLVTALAVSFPIGPILGGWLLSTFWWGSVFLINVPVVVMALIAGTAFLPESRNPERPRLDIAGVLTSSAGLAALTYGAIEAGTKGWSDPGALGPLMIGAFVLTAFVFWQHRINRRPGGQPLVDLALFRSASFTWGTILATVASFAMFGVLFAAPQHFQAVDGADPLGAGLRLLPFAGGLLVGSRVAARLDRSLGAKGTVAVGFILLAGGLFAGASTTVESGDVFVAAWIAVVGLGIGFVLPTAMSAALGALSAERSGVGSALLQAVRQVGATIGVAVLGTVLSTGYRSRLEVAGLPPPAAETVRESVFAGVAVAQQLDSSPLLASVRAAFVFGMDTMLWVSGGLMVLGLVLTLVFMPRSTDADVARDSEQPELEAFVSCDGLVACACVTSNTQN